MKTIISLFALLALLTTGRATELETSEYLGEVKFVEAEQDAAQVETAEEAGRYLLIGFQSLPVVLDVSDEAHPVLLADYLLLDSEGELGAYLSHEGAAELKAIGEEKIIEVESISLK